MRIAIVGSRKPSIGGTTPVMHIEEIKNIIFREFLRHNIKYPTLVSGGAEGIDSIAEGLAKGCGHPTLIFKPEWNKYGKSAGFKRNQKIVDAADKIVVITFGDSAGSMDTLRRAKESGKPTTRYNFISMGAADKEEFNVS